MIKKIKNTKLLILVLLLVIPTFSSIVRRGYFPMHDDMQAMRLLQMDKCVQDGQVPCRWVPDMGYGYGYPQFNFYGPFPYYLMEVFHLVGFGFLDSVKIGFLLSVVVSAVGMYLLGKSLWGKWGGFISGLLFVYAPYRAVDMYVRGAVGEFWALTVLPFIFWSSREVVKGSKKHVVWLALSLSTLFTSHNITTLITIPVFILWVLLQFVIEHGYPTKNNKKYLIDVFFGSLWGFIISAFYTIPVWFERKFVHIETLLQGYFNYLAHFVSINQMLFSTYFGYGTSELGSHDNISFAVGIIHWTLPLLALLMFWFLKRTKKVKKGFLNLIFLVVVGWIALFLMHPRSVYIWQKINILSYLQFPWRFLIIATFVFSAATGSITLFLKDGKRSKVVIGSLLIFVLLFYASFFKPSGWIDITDEEKFSGESWRLQQTISIFDYLPIYADAPPADRAPEQPKAVEGEIYVLDGKEGTDWQRWSIDVVTDSAVVEFPLFYFPGWEMKVDGEVKVINYDNDLGLITSSFTKGKHNTDLKLKNTPVRNIGNALSLVGLVAIPVYLNKLKDEK